MINQTNNHALFLPSGCLTASTLESLASDTLQGKDLQICLEHLDQCALCSDSLAGLREWLSSDHPGDSGQMQDTSAAELQSSRRLGGHPSRKPFREKISGINERVQNRVRFHKETQKKQHRITFPFPNRWVSLAASIILFAGIYYVVRMKPSVEDQALAKQSVTVPDPDAATDSAGKAVTPPPVTLQQEKEVLFPDSPVHEETADQIVLDDQDEIKKQSEEFVVEGLVVEDVTKREAAGYKPAVSPPIEKVPDAANESLTITGYAQQKSRTVSMNKEMEESPEAFTVVEEMPIFPGGTESMQKFILENLRYPELAKESGIEGIVYARFIVDSDGMILNARVVRGIGGGCDEEVLRLIHAMPPWKPGKQRGKPVAVEMGLPIQFKLGQ